MPPPQPATWTLSAYGLPAHALRILGACVVSLVLWFSAGRAVREALMWAGTEISHGDHRQVRLAATTLIFTLVVLNRLVVTVGMLHAVRGALREIRVRRAGNEADESLSGALTRSTPVFAVIYVAWSLHVEDARVLDLTGRAGQDVRGAFTGIQGEAGTGPVALDVRLSVGIAVAACLLKVLCRRWHAGGGGRGSGMLAAFFALVFAFYGVHAAFTAASAWSEWLSRRVVVASVTGWAERAAPWWKAFLAWAGEVWPYAVDALIVPLTWLAVAALVYGAFAGDARAVVRGVRTAAVAGGLERAPFTRSAVARATAGLRERWVPSANAFRLAVRGGVVLFGMFCLCYVALRVGADYADREARTLIGSEERYLWLVLGPPVSFVRDLVVAALTTCLLAATFDVAATRGREAGALTA